MIGIGGHAESVVTGRFCVAGRVQSGESILLHHLAAALELKPEHLTEFAELTHMPIVQAATWIAQVRALQETSARLHGQRDYVSHYPLDDDGNVLDSDFLF
jgi:hypothetical protein